MRLLPSQHDPLLSLPYSPHLNPGPVLCDFLVVPDAVEEVRTNCMKPPIPEVDPNTRFDILSHLLVTEVGKYKHSALRVFIASRE